MPRPQFSIRDLLWLTLVVAAGCAIWPAIMPHCGKFSTSYGVECNWYYWRDGSGGVVFVELPTSSTFMKRSPHLDWPIPNAVRSIARLPIFQAAAQKVGFGISTNARPELAPQAEPEYNAEMRRRFRFPPDIETMGWISCVVFATTMIYALVNSYFRAMNG